MTIKSAKIRKLDKLEDGAEAGRLWMLRGKESLRGQGAAVHIESKTIPTEVLLSDARWREWRNTAGEVYSALWRQSLSSI